VAQAAVQEKPTNGPDEEAVITVNLGKIQAAKMAHDAAGNEFRSVLKHAEGKGVHIRAAKIALKIVASGDPDAWLEETGLVSSYLRMLRHGITDTQLMLEFEEPLAPIDEKAGLDGLASGRLGFNQEGMNPHALNTKAGQAWLAAFRQGRAEYELIMSMKDDPEDEDDIDSRDDEDDED